MIRVTIWNEFRHERKEKRIADVYPNGMHQRLAEEFKTQPDFEVRTATLDEPEHGLSQEVLDNTDAHPQKVINLGHPTSIALSQIIVNGY